MKTSFILAFICLLNITASVYSQNTRLNIDVRETTIREVFKLIESQSEFRFFYNDAFVDLNKQITCNAKEARVEDILKEILKETNVSFKVLENLIVLAPTVELYKQQGITITGTVIDETGQPMPGVNVVVKGTTTGVITDINGRYSITVPDANATLVFSFIGYAAQEFAVGNQRAINVTLDVVAREIEEVEIVAIGYGSVRKRDLTGSVASANMDEVLKAPVGSVLDGMAGRVSGMEIMTSDGQPGAAAHVVIRGGNSITGNNRPLYVLDGFVQGDNFNMNLLSPNDIASVNILKDASSTAIYGSRGANGVVLITTKRGLAGKPQIAYNGRFGIQKVTKHMELLSPYEFVLLDAEHYAGYTTNPWLYRWVGTGPDEGYFEQFKTLDHYRNAKGIEWEKEILRTATYQDHQLSVRGGTEETKYNFSAAYNGQDGVIIKTGYKRYTGSVNIDQKLTKWLNGGVNAYYSFQESQGPVPSTASYSAYGLYLMYMAWSFRPITENGVDLMEQLRDPGTNNSDQRVNPVWTTKNEYRKNINSSLTTNSYLEFSIMKGLKLRVMGSLSQYSYRNEEFNNSKTVSGAPWTVDQINGNVSFINTSNWVNENYLTYEKSISKHRLSVVAATTFQGWDQRTFGYETKFIPNEELGISGIDQGTIATMSASVDPGWGMVSYLGRIIYDYRSRYLITLSARADGSSKFSKGNKWGYFPSVSAAWRFSEEEFLKKQKILSNGKLRFSWGITGNNAISNSSIFNQLTTPVGRQYPILGVWNTAAFVSALGNRGLVWESTEQTNAGIDLGFLKDRIVLTVDVYKKNTYDLLLTAPLPSSTGFGSVTKNVGAVSNRGLEISLQTMNIKNKNFYWETLFNISMNRNQVEKLVEGQHSLLTTVSWDQNFNPLPAYISKIGQPVGQMFGYQWDGVYQVEDFDYAENGIYTCRPDVPSYMPNGNNVPGDVKYKDINGDGVVDDYDRAVIGNPTPLHYGGLLNTFGYRNFNLSVFFQWSYGNDVLNANRYLMEWGYQPCTNQFATFADRWRPDHTNTTMQRSNSNGMKLYSSRVVEDASFLRLKTVSLGYTVSKKYVDKLRIKGLALNVSAQNLYTWTNYSGYDPEVSSRHSTLTKGFDFSTYPRARTVTFGLNVTF